MRRCMEAIGSQVDGVAKVLVVGGGDEIRHIAGEFEAAWRPNLRAAISSIGPEFTFVWALRERAIPDPQALRVLVQDGQRVGAGIAGSKIVAADRRELLLSVGYATDVFAAPYSGLLPGEVDQQQYDVIRDVAAQRDLVFVDAAAALEAASEHGLVGDDLFVEFAHPNLRAQQVIAAEVEKVMRSSGTPRPGEAWPELEWQETPSDVLMADDPSLRISEHRSILFACVVARRPDCRAEQKRILRSLRSQNPR